MSGEPIRFYFDFISPFAYLGSVAVERLAARLGREVEWRPVLIGITILKIMGMKPLPRNAAEGSLFAARFRPPGRLSRRAAGARCGADGQLIAPLPPMRAFVMLNDRDPALAKRFAQEVFAAAGCIVENPVDAGRADGNRAAVRHRPCTVARRERGQGDERAPYCIGRRRDRARRVSASRHSRSGRNCSGARIIAAARALDRDRRMVAALTAHLSMAPICGAC